MSAMQLSENHLSVIAYGLKKFKIVDQFSRDENIVKYLLDQNLRSYKATYPKDRECEDDFEGFYEYKHPVTTPTMIELFKLTQCYQYNSDESPTWETSEVKRWTDRLLSAAIQSLPGYEKAKWSI